MDRKHRKYVVNVEPSGNQLPSICPHDQEAYSSQCWCLPSHDITGDVSSNLSGVWMSAGIPAQLGCPHFESSNTQVKGNSRSGWSVWKAFLACLLACVVTTTIGVLILSLVNNKGNNSSIVIQIPLNNGEPLIIVSGTTSTTTQSTVTTASTQSTTSATTTETTATTITSTQPETTTATTTTSAEPTSTTTSTESTTVQRPLTLP